MFSIQLRLATAIAFLAAFISLPSFASASENARPTPGPLVPGLPSSEPTRPPAPPPTPIPTAAALPPIPGPPPLPTAPPTAHSLIEFGPAATIVLPSSAASVVTYNINGIFQLVSLPQDQIVQVVLQYPTFKAAELVKVEALDGGLLAASVSAAAPESVSQMTPVTTRVNTGMISVNGTFTFAFRAGHSPGLYQLRITRPAPSPVLGLQFWIEDAQHPANNPPALRPVSAAPTQPPI
jgi:hypothetical protein